ncbi:MAG TPA: hypothetical protein VF501_10905 [Thiobacillus sp.]
MKNSWLDTGVGLPMAGPADFGLNFLRHTLFGEKFVEERPDAYEKRLARRRALAEQAKEAEFQPKMAREDDKYSGDH